MHVFCKRRYDFSETSSTLTFDPELHDVAVVLALGVLRRALVPARPGPIDPLQDEAPVAQYEALARVLPQKAALKERIRHCLI